MTGSTHCPHRPSTKVSSEQEKAGARCRAVFEDRRAGSKLDVQTWAAGRRSPAIRCDPWQET